MSISGSISARRVAERIIGRAKALQRAGARHGAVPCLSDHSSFPECGRRSCGASGMLVVAWLSPLGRKPSQRTCRRRCCSRGWISGRPSRVKRSTSCSRRRGYVLAKEELGACTAHSSHSGRRSTCCRASRTSIPPVTKPDELVGVVDAAVAVEAGEVTAVGLVLRVFESEGQHALSSSVLCCCASMC